MSTSKGMRLALIGVREPFRYAAAAYRAGIVKLAYSTTPVSFSDAPYWVEPPTPGSSRIVTATADELLTSHVSEFDAAVIGVDCVGTNGAPPPAELAPSELASSKPAGPNGRFELIGRLAAFGKPILASGPIVTDLDELRELFTVCDASKVPLVAERALRFSPYYQIPRDRLADGDLGRPGLLRVHDWQSQQSAQSRPAIDWIERQVHNAMEIFGDRPDVIHGRELTSQRGLQLHLGFPEGGMALLGQAWKHEGGGPYSCVTLIGSSGASYADDHRNANLLMGDALEGLTVGMESTPLARQLADFCDIVNDPTRWPDGGDCLRACEVAQAASQAVESKQTARWTGGSYGFD